MIPTSADRLTLTTTLIGKVIWASAGGGSGDEWATDVSYISQRVIIVGRYEKSMRWGESVLESVGSAVFIASFESGEGRLDWLVSSVEGDTVSPK